MYILGYPLFISWGSSLVIEFLVIKQNIGPHFKLWIDVVLMIVPQKMCSFTVMGARKTWGYFNIFLLNDFVLFLLILLVMWVTT